MRRASVATLTAAVLLALSAGSCRTGRDELSGPDGKRIGAAALALDTIADDTISVLEGDATDWRYLDLENPGQLTIQVHWDDERANLNAALYDALGQQLAAGEVWGQKGRQVELEVPERGRYYVRVWGDTDRDASTYSVKALFAKKTATKCHNCTVGQRICVGKDAYAVCALTKDNCNAWVEINSCSADQSCNEGVCAVGCVDQCKLEDRRCASNTSVQLCARSSGGCLQWGPPSGCEPGFKCEPGGKCKKEPGKAPPPPPPPPGPKVDEASWAKGKIISMYTREGQKTLHIEIGESSGVTAGNTGVVLEGNTDNPVDNGQFKVIRVTNNFCIATTALEAIGNNRNVKIRIK